jgi:hypothetical protein
MTSTENTINAASNRLMTIESAMDQAVQAALTALHPLDLQQDTMDDIEFNIREAIEHSSPEVFVAEVKQLSEIIHDPCAETMQSMIDHIRDRKAPD